MKPLKGKVAVCTGSGRQLGLGQGILKRLAEQGASVVVTDIGRTDGALSADNVGASDEMEQVAQELRDAGAQAIAVACDVRSEEQIDRLVETTVGEFGRLDIMVNNAGVGYLMQPLEEVTAENWRLVIDINLTGAFLCTKAAAIQMRKQGDGGRIVNIASQAAKSGFPHLPAYVASKHGMVGLTRATAIELAPDQITVNAVCPNHVTTGLGAKQNEYFARYRGVSVEEYRANLKARIPLGRVGLVEDTAAATAFLCSDDAAFITGEAMNVSGGEEMH
ncbi:MAG: SDR family NAD(P)-dependent oxidoreductase [Lysobacterales bacterium]